MFLSGDRDAFHRIYKVHVNAVFNYGMKIVPDRALVQDCIQDLFVDLWEKRDRLGKTDAIKLYLYKSLKRKLVRELGRWKMKEAHAEEVRVHLNLTSVRSHEVDIIETQKLEDIKKQLQRAVAGLTKRQQEALFLKFYEGFNHDQIASIMELNSQSVYNLIYQALKVLRHNYKFMAPIPFLPLLSLQFA